MTMTISLIFLAILFMPIMVSGEIVVIVHADSEITDVSQRDVKRLFLGKSQKLPGGASKMMVFNLPRESDLRTEFENKVLMKTQQQLRSYWVGMVFSGKATPPMVVDGEDDVIRRVLSHPNGIGYIDRKHLDNSVKAVFSVF